MMATLSELITAKDDTPPPSQLQQQQQQQQPGSAASFHAGASQQQGSTMMPAHMMRSSQNSPCAERMPQLKQLMLSTDEDPATPHPANVARVKTAEECVDELLAEGAPPDSALGQAVDNLFVSWNQLILDLSARPGFMAPTAEHIKEVAECTVRQLKDSCQELTGEFAKVGLEWRLAHPEEALAEDLANYDQAIMRQETLIGRAAGMLQRRLDDFANEPSDL